MKPIVFLIFAVLLFGDHNFAQAQSSLEGFSTGRYEVRKSVKSKRLPSSEEGGTESSVTDSEGIKVQLLTPSQLAAEKAAEEKAEKNKKKLDKLKPKVSQKEAGSEKVNIEKAPELEPAKASVAEKTDMTEKVTQEPSISEQAESLFANKTDKVYEYYRQEVHPEDVRNNKVEIDFAPLLIYNDSSSNYSFRKYQSFFEALKLKASVWLTPLIGVSGQYMFSFGADVDDANHSKISTKYEYVDLGLNFRKFFGISRKANSLEFSVLYSDNSFRVSNESTMHSRLKSNGLGVGLKARLPSSGSYSWVLGGSFFPRLQHSESATAVNARSGSTDENTRLEFDLGGEWLFSRYSQMVWNLGVSSERNLFSGTASLPDSSTGSTPSNVSVTNTLYMLNLGYRWGH